MKKVYIVIAHPKMDDSYVFDVYSSNKKAKEIAEWLEGESLDGYQSDPLCVSWTKYEVKEYIVDEGEK